MNIQTLPEIRTISCWPGLLPSSVRVYTHIYVQKRKKKYIFLFLFFFLLCYVFCSFLPKPMKLPPFWTHNPATFSQPISLPWPLSAIFSTLSFLSFICNNIQLRQRERERERECMHMRMYVCAHIKYMHMHFYLFKLDLPFCFHHFSLVGWGEKKIQTSIIKVCIYIYIYIYIRTCVYIYVNI